MKRLVLVALLLASVSAAASLPVSADEPLPTLPTEEYLPIPGGMSFLHGEWVRYDQDRRIMVEPGTIRHLDVVEVPNDYRVLHEGPNYVLFIYRHGASADWMRTAIGLFTLEREPLFPTDDPVDADLHWSSCTPPEMENAEAFNRPDDWVLAQFRSNCPITTGNRMFGLFAYSQFRSPSNKLLRRPYDQPSG